MSVLTSMMVSVVIGLDFTIASTSTSLFRSLCNLGIFRTRVYSEPKTYSEPWYIQKPGIFRTLSNIYDGGFSRQLTAILFFFLIQVSLVFQKYLFDVKYGD